MENLIKTISNIDIPSPFYVQLQFHISSVSALHIGHVAQCLHAPDWYFQFVI